MYFIQADNHLLSHITRKLSKLGDCTSKIICTRVVKLLISQWAVVRPAYFTSCQNSLAPVYIIATRFTLWQADFSGFFNVVCPCHAMNVVCPCHAMNLCVHAMPWMLCVHGMPWMLCVHAMPCHECCVSMARHGIGWPWLCHYITVWLTWYQKQQQQQQVYTYWSQMLKKVS